LTSRAWQARYGGPNTRMQDMSPQRAAQVRGYGSRSSHYYDHAEAQRRG
jgi:hypothetical protein